MLCESDRLAVKVSPSILVGCVTTGDQYTITCSRAEALLQKHVHAGTGETLEQIYFMRSPTESTKEAINGRRELTTAKLGFQFPALLR